MSATCFQCREITESVTGPRCPRCDYPLIVSARPPSDADREDVQSLLEQRKKYVPLPGISAKSRIHPTWQERRVARRRAVEAEKITVTTTAQRRRLAEVFVASGLVSAIAASLLVLF